MFVRLSDMIPASEMDERTTSKISSNVSVSLNLCYLRNLVSPSPGKLYSAKKHVMLRIQIFFSTIALFIRMNLLCSSICRLPPNGANGVAVFEGRAMQYSVHVQHSRITLQKKVADRRIDRKNYLPRSRSS